VKATHQVFNPREGTLLEKKKENRFIRQTKRAVRPSRNGQPPIPTKAKKKD